jgi:hypothetical protein
VIYTDCTVVGGNFNQKKSIQCQNLTGLKGIPIRNYDMLMPHLTFLLKLLARIHARPSPKPSSVA